MTEIVTVVKSVREYVSTRDERFAALQYQALASTFGPVAVADPTAKVWVRRNPDGDETTLLAVSGAKSA